MEAAFKTDCGKIREHNEDSGGVFSNHSDLLLAVVADGMGGHRAGDVASSLALDFLMKNWKSAEPNNFQTKEASRKWLCETINEANTYVLSYAKLHPECQGMGTTIVVALCSPEFLTIAHVGDSRGYLLRENELIQITKDHSLVNELVRQGEITEDEAASHPRKNVILQALGTEKHVESEAVSFDWHLGDVVLLCSDGLTDNVSREQLESVLRSELSMNEKADELTRMANFAGGNDNITLTLVRLTRDQIHRDEFSRAGSGEENGGSNDGEFFTKECR